MYQCNNLNKVSHLTQNERDENIPQEPHITHCYPCNHNGKWQAIEENKDANKYGLYQGPKIANMSAANVSNSLSCKAVLALIMVKAIYLMKDTEKLGLYIQLVEEALDAFLFVYKVEGNFEFSEILHLCLFSFDSVSLLSLNNYHKYIGL